jgi:hypothetical protein
LSCGVLETKSAYYKSFDYREDDPPPPPLSEEDQKWIQELFEIFYGILPILGSLYKLLSSPNPQ